MIATFRNTPIAGSSATDAVTDLLLKEELEKEFQKGKEILKKYTQRPIGE